MEAGRKEKHSEETAAGRKEEHRYERTTDSRIKAKKDVKKRRGKITCLLFARSSNSLI